jgi:hypothetical protein
MIGREKRRGPSEVHLPGYCNNIPRSGRKNEMR